VFKPVVIVYCADQLTLTGEDAESEVEARFDLLTHKLLYNEKMSADQHQERADTRGLRIICQCLQSEGISKLCNIGPNLHSTEGVVSWVNNQSYVVLFKTVCITGSSQSKL
jgi:hypothetical protein